MNVAVHARGERAPRPLLRAALIQAVKATLRSEHSRVRGEVNVILTDRSTIRRLNRRFLDEPGDTDVIAFPYSVTPAKAGAQSSPMDSRLRGNDGMPFGDIYISVPVARDNARRFHDEADRELIRLAVHGTLHLLGYEDHSRKDHAEMWKRQERLVERLTRRRTVR